MDKKHSFVKKNQLASVALALVILLIVSTGVFAADGDLDMAFGSHGTAITDLGSKDTGLSVLLQPDEKIVMLASSQGQSPVLMRFNPNGSVDSTFGVGGKLTVDFGTEIALQADGKLIVAGSRQGSFAVARYLSNGKGLDTSFGTGGVALFPFNTEDFRYVFSDLAMQPDGKIVLVGTQETLGHTTYIIIVRFTSNGQPDDSFVAHGFTFLDDGNFPQSAYFRGQAVAVQPGGKLVVSANMYSSSDTIEQIGVARLKPDGSLDTENFGTNGKGTVVITLPNISNARGSLALQADGKIVVAGTVFSYGSSTNDDLVLARFTPGGSLDPDFGGSGIVTTDIGKNENANGVVIQEDGKIVIVGQIFDGDPSDILVVRYTSDGSLDDTFGINGKVITDLGGAPDSGRAIAVQPDGKLVVAGSSSENALLARYLKDISGLPETEVTFNSTGGRDGWILESLEDSNKGGTLNRVATTFFVGDDQKDRQYKSILSFNTDSIPDNAIITAAELRVRRQGVVGSNPFATHGFLLVDIKNSAFSGSLILQVSDFKAAAAGRDRVLASGGTWYSAALKATNLSLINKYGATQFRLRFSKDDNDDMSADYIKFFSGEALDANRPMLIITYVVP